MTLCPVAIGVGCKKCPVFGICPLKSVIGDAPANPPPPTTEKKPAARSSTKKK